MKGGDIPEDISAVDACAQFSTSFAREVSLTFTASELSDFSSGSGTGIVLSINFKIISLLVIDGF